MDELIGYGGTAEGCPVCIDEHCATLLPFASDAAAVAHIRQHSREELAFALLTHKALVQRFLVAADTPEGVQTEQHAEELIGDVEGTAMRSPARLRQA
ncbi:hypothetical protein [Streptomyces crystallinus]|uniref:C2H2-type domain-containing protein n=1 Tax=Streptomyces crystallinus TaxID=68191 RepID=A0ABP3Q540_9ACTN